MQCPQLKWNCWKCDRSRYWKRKLFIVIIFLFLNSNRVKLTKTGKNKWQSNNHKIVGLLLKKKTIYCDKTFYSWTTIVLSSQKLAWQFDHHRTRRCFNDSTLEDVVKSQSKSLGVGVGSLLLAESCYNIDKPPVFGRSSFSTSLRLQPSGSGSRLNRQERGNREPCLL